MNIQEYIESNISVQESLPKMKLDKDTFKHIVTKLHKDGYSVKQLAALACKSEVFIEELLK